MAGLIIILVMLLIYSSLGEFREIRNRRQLFPNAYGPPTYQLTHDLGYEQISNVIASNQPSYHGNPQYVPAGNRQINTNAAIGEGVQPNQAQNRFSQGSAGSATPSRRCYNEDRTNSVPCSGRQPYEGPRQVEGPAEESRQAPSPQTSRPSPNSAISPQQIARQNPALRSLNPMDQLLAVRPTGYDPVTLRELENILDPSSSSRFAPGTFTNRNGVNQPNVKVLDLTG